jgi:hypothetical protein
MVAVTTAFVAAFANPGTLQRHSDAPRRVVTVPAVALSPDDVTDDSSQTPVLEACALLAALVILVRPREVAWWVHQVDEADSSGPSGGDEPCRAATAAIAWSSPFSPPTSQGSIR